MKSKTQSIYLGFITGDTSLCNYYIEYTVFTLMTDVMISNMYTFQRRYMYTCHTGLHAIVAPFTLHV